MKLMTEEIKQVLIKAHEEYDDETMTLVEQPIIVKYFHPMSRYTFYAVSGEDYGDDMVMFGYCLSPLTPDYDEYGYVSLSELQSIPLMERDLYFHDKILKDVV